MFFVFYYRRVRTSLLQLHSISCLKGGTYFLIMTDFMKRRRETLEALMKPLLKTAASAPLVGEEKQLQQQTPPPTTAAAKGVQQPNDDDEVDRLSPL